MTEFRTTTETNDVVVSQRISAPPEDIFEFLVEPDKVLRWMGIAVDIEPKPGGKFLVDINGTSVASGRYVEVDRPNRVEFTWGWESSTDVPPGSSTVTITLTPDGADTIVELNHSGLPGGPDDPHREGWSHFLPRLAAVAQGEDPGPDSYVDH